MTRKEIYLVLSIACLFIFIPTFLFLYTFIGLDISNDISNWGSFGDYFGGIINCLSLFVTIYIAIKISKIEENRNKENLKFEREKLLREFRESEYKRINSELQKVWFSMTEPNLKKAEEIIYYAILQYRYFVTSNKHLFNFLNDKEIHNLRKSLDEILKILRKDEISEIDPVLKTFVENLDLFNQKFQIFLLNN